MAKNQKNEKEQIYFAKKRGGKSGASTAKYNAREYVWSGIEKTNLSSKDQKKLADKLIPVVQSHMQTSQDKTANRASMIENRKRKQEISKAKKNVLGGK
jgi:hypothetical protein